MQKLSEGEKSCVNCRYYSQHYAKDNSRYITVCCGHCVNRNNKKMKPVLCDYWESAGIKKRKKTCG